MEVKNGDEEKLKSAVNNKAKAQRKLDNAKAKGENLKGVKSLLNKLNVAYQSVNNSFAGANLQNAIQAYDHTAAAIQNYKLIDPVNFAKADNLAYTDKNGNSNKLDIYVSSGHVSGNNDKGETSFGLVSRQSGVISGNMIQTTIDMNISPASDVLAHELGHGVSIANDPVGYAIARSNASKDYNCQDAANANNPLSIDALRMQHQYDENLKSYNNSWAVTWWGSSLIK